MAENNVAPLNPSLPRKLLVDRVLGGVERVGNRLPDPAVLFIVALALTWGLSAALSPVEFAELDPRTGKPLQVVNQLTGAALAAFLSNMVGTFTGFPPLGYVLVVLLGVGVAERTGFVHAGLKGLLGFTPARLLTPMVLLVSIVSHSVGDASFVLVVPLGGVAFAAAGRHPLAGVATAFAGVAGGFGANLLPSGVDPLLQGFTQSAAQLLEPGRLVNPLCNWGFSSVSSVLLVLLGWYVTDRILEPRLQRVPVDAEAEVPQMEALRPAERRGLAAGLAVVGLGLGLLVLASTPQGSPLRSPQGELTAFGAPLMRSIVPLIFLFFFLPGVVYGYVAGTVKSHRDIIQAMSQSMGSMGYYLVLTFFAALFTEAFRQSNLGALLALKGAATLSALHVPGAVTLVGVILLTALVDLLIGSSSAKWALLAPILVPMLMKLGLSPELTQAAYRVGDSVTNIITPLLPYFPLMVVYCQRYVRSAGAGTVLSTMLPYSAIFLVGWTALLLVCWALGVPLGLQAGYTYP